MTQGQGKAVSAADRFPLCRQDAGPEGQGIGAAFPRQMRQWQPGAERYAAVAKMAMMRPGFPLIDSCISVPFPVRRNLPSACSCARDTESGQVMPRCPRIGRSGNPAARPGPGRKPVDPDGAASAGPACDRYRPGDPASLQSPQARRAWACLPCRTRAPAFWPMQPANGAGGDRAAPCTGSLRLPGPDAPDRRPAASGPQVRAP